MSWNLHFELAWRGGGPVPAELRRKAGRVLKSCFKRTKNLGLTVLEPSEEEPLRGSVQILLREGNNTDPRALLNPDPTKGTGVFRTTSNVTEHVYRAQLPQLDGRKVARSFLERLAARQLIEWCGPRTTRLSSLPFSSSK